MSNYIGATLSVAASTPATDTGSAFAALSGMAEIGKIVDISEIGDTHEDLTSNLLKTGRTDHSNGTKDGGEVTVTVEYAVGDNDAGLAIIKAGAGGTTEHSFEIADPDGETFYMRGVIANFRHRARSTSNKKGFTFVFRVNSAVIEA